MAPKAKKQNSWTEADADEETGLLEKLEDGEGVQASIKKNVEKTKATRDTCASLFHGKPLTVIDHGYVVKYNVNKLSTLGVFCTFHGTVLKSPVMWLDESLVALLFFGVASGVYWGLREDSVVWVAKIESHTRGFVGVMQTLAAFLLSFYVALSVKRWWAMRTHGVGAVVKACAELQLFLSQFVTADELYLQPIRRYARASLIMIWLNNEDVATEDPFAEKELLTTDEWHVLSGFVNHPQIMWVWITKIVATLKEKGFIDDGHLLTMLLERCSSGRSGVQSLQTSVNTQIPLIYVHLLTLMVKVHNIFLAGFMGVIFPKYLIEKDYIICFQVAARVFFLTFLFNSLLTIAEMLHNPFTGDSNDFPMPVITNSMEKVGLSYIKAGEALPEWLAAEQQSKRPPKK